MKFCEMGKLTYITGNDAHGNHYTQKCFLQYAATELFKNPTTEDVQEEIKNQLRCIEVIRKKYRNPAAHTERLSSEEAKDCIEYIIEKDKVLCSMIIAYRY